MHELSLIAHLMRTIEAVAREQEAVKVVSIRVKMGALSHLSADHFRAHFLHAATGTIAAGATLHIEALSDINDPHAQDVLLESVEVIA